MWPRIVGNPPRLFSSSVSKRKIEHEHEDEHEDEDEIEDEDGQSSGGGAQDSGPDSPGELPLDLTGAARRGTLCDGQ